MNKSFKLMKFATIVLSGLCISETFADCPELTRDEIRTICRWKVITKLTLGLVQAGTLEKNGVQLKNNGTCGEKDSFEQFWKQDQQKTYAGTLTKDFADPTNPLKGLCTYSLGKQKVGFSVTLPPKPAPAVPAETEKENTVTEKRPKTEFGVDILASPEKKRVIIGEHGKIMHPPSRVRPSQEGEGEGVEAKESELLRAKTQPNPSSRAPKRPPPQAPRPVPSSNPPSYLPPAAPTAAPAPVAQDKAAEVEGQNELAQKLARQRMRAEGQE